MHSDIAADKQDPGLSQSSLDPDVWAHFLSVQGVSGHTHYYFRDWLTLQASLLPASSKAVLIIGDFDTGQFQPAAIWPGPDSDVTILAELAEEAIEQRNGLVTDMEPMDGVAATLNQQYAIAYPLVMDGKVFGSVAVEVETDNQHLLQSVMTQLQWGAAWLELKLRRTNSERDQQQIQRMSAAVELLASVHAASGFKASATAFVTELAGLVKCDRVSLGLLSHKGHTSVEVLSHSAEIGKHMNLIRALGSVMDESLDQRKAIVYPAKENQSLLVTREHERLVKQQGESTVMTIPVVCNGKVRGAVCFERASGNFSESDVELCENVIALAGPALLDKYHNDRHILRKIADSFWAQCRKLFGHGYPGRKLAALSIIAAVAVLSLLTGQYQLSADIVLEGRTQRIISSPFEGYIRQANYRAGDIVRKGQVLAILDDRDLRLERLKKYSELSKYRRQKQEALASRTRAETIIHNAQIDRVTAELRLIDSRLARTIIKSPIDGLVVKGDLSQKLGIAVKQGEELFTITPLKGYRVILKVDERRIADVKQGQTGNLILSALPNHLFPFRVTRVTPVSVADSGLNYFRVEARLLESSTRLRPGMEGVGKIRIDERKLLSIWTRSFREWWAMWWWSW